MSKESILRLEHVCKSFATNDTDVLTYALNDINLTIRSGEFVSVVGPSGCGKTTMLMLIAGLSSPTSGKILLDDKPIQGPSPQNGVVFQKPMLFPWLTVEKNVAFSLKMQGTEKEHKDDVDRLIRTAGLEEFRNVFPHQLSGGMAQRVALIRSMVNDPNLFLMDEPLGALDAFTRMGMQDELLAMGANRKRLMMLVTHDVDEAIYLGTRILVMAPRPGTIINDLPIDMPYPRNRTSAKFMDYRKQVLEMLKFGTSENTAGKKDKIPMCDEKFGTYVI